MTESRSGAQYLAEALVGYGVSHVFFIEAVARNTLVELEALGVQRIMAHSEKAAAYMADGYARATGRVGICMCQAVGAANLAAGLQDAWLARSPLLAITGHKAIPQLQRNAYQEIDHRPMFEPVTAFRASVEDTSQLPFLLRQAMRAASGPTPRPAHLDLAGLTGEVIERGTIADPLPAEPRHGSAPAHRSVPDASDLDAAARLIDASERPLVVLGAGAMLGGAPEPVRSLAARGIPIAYGLDAKGLVEDDLDGVIGVVGNYSAPYANRVVHEADLVLYVGSDTSDMTTGDWRVVRPDAAIVQIDADAAELGRNFPGACGLLGDAGLALAALESRLADRDRSAWTDRAMGLRRAWFEEVEPLRSSSASPVTVERLCRELETALPQNALLVADTGYSGIWTGTHVGLNHPGQSYIRAAGSLGWSFPAALGAQAALPDRPVVCFCGDGGFFYHLPELETARRWNIPVTVVVNNNGAFGHDIAGVRAAYGGRNGRAEDLTHFEPVDFSRVAESFGCRGVRVEDPEAIGDAIRDGIASGVPSVIDVATDPEPRAPAAWYPPA